MKKKFLVLMLAIVTLFTLTSCSKKLTVEFDTDGGSRIVSETVKKGKTITAPTAPTKEGYKFEYWELNGEKFDFSTKIKKDITLKAVWQKTACSHVWTPATCDAPKTCTKCNATEGNKLDHEWKAATCAAPKTCVKCNATEGTKLEHNWVDATCDAPKHCTNCNDSVGEALGHTWSNATCEDPKHCSVCNKTEDEALGHTWSNATCEDPKTCTVCNKTEGEALGHKWVDATYQKPKTCSECGKTEGSKLTCETHVDADKNELCDNCGVKVDENGIEVTCEHEWADATCAAPKTCTKCNKTDGDALPHTWVDATCAAPKTCSECGETLGSALPHTWSDATCLDPKHCTKCDATEGEALGHDWVEASCEDPKHCSRCDATEGEALGHKWVDATYTAPKTCSECGKTEGSPLICTEHVDENNDSVCDRCGANTSGPSTEYKPKWEPNQQTGGWNGNGMTVKILVLPKSSWDPFDPAYTGTNKKILQKQIRNIEKAYGIDLVYEDWPDAAAWGPTRVEYIKTKTNSGDFANEDVYVVNIASSWIPTLANAGCLAELATLDAENNAESGIFTEIGYQETYEGSGKYVPGTYLQDPTNNQVTSSVGKVYGYVTGIVRPDYFMYFNADLIAEVAMEDPAELWLKGQWTWSNFEKYCADLQAALGEGQYSLSVGFPEFVIGSTASTGSKIATTRPSLGLTTTAVLERFQAIQRLFASGCYEKRNVEDVSQGFLEGNVAIVHGDLWFMKDASRFNPQVCDFTIGAVPYPTADNDGGEPLTTLDASRAIKNYYGEPLELEEGSGEYISGVDMSMSSFMIPYGSTGCDSIIDTAAGKNGINNKIIFAILYDLNSGLGDDPDKIQVSEDVAYRNWLLTKFDKSLYADVIMSVQRDYTYFELIELVSMTVGGGSHFGPNAFWPLAATICKDSSISPATKLNEVLGNYKEAMAAMGYILPN